MYLERFLKGFPHPSGLNVKKIFSSGLKIYTWTVNNKLDIIKVKSLKVDGIITDFPEKI